MFHHITPAKNLLSIKENGLLPRPPLIHDFTEYGVTEVIYSQTADTDYDIKYIKDFIYCKHFIDPINRYHIENPWERIGEKLPKGFRFNFWDEEYVVLGIEKKVWWDECFHVQDDTINDTFKDLLPYKFELYMHNAKQLGLFDRKVEPQYIKVVGEAEFTTGRFSNRKMDFSIKANIFNKNKWLMLKEGGLICY